MHIPQDFNLTQNNEQLDLINQISNFTKTLPEDMPLKLVIIDTFFNQLGGESDNAPEVVGQVIAVAKKIIKMFQCAVIFVDHPGHSDQTRPRGHSSKKPASNAFFLLTGNIEKGLTLTTTKLKNIKKLKPYSIEFEIVDSGYLDEREEPLTYPVAKEVITTWDGKLQMLGHKAENTFFALFNKFEHSVWKFKDANVLLDNNNHATSRLLKQFVNHKLITKQHEGYIINNDANPRKLTFNI